MTGDASRGRRAGGRREPVRVHKPVLLHESLEAMHLSPGLTAVDGTVGAGGHSVHFGAGIAPDGLLLGLDRDAEILSHAEAAIGQAASAEGFRYRLIHTAFAELEKALDAEGIEAIDRCFLDIGVSSLQIDSPGRGFSFMHDGPLDMRMDQSASLTAAQWLQRVSESELERVLKEYGEERFARRIAKSIVEVRKRHGIETTAQLADLVLRAMPGPARQQRIHPATRTFQALRIAVNDELGQLERGLQGALNRLSEGGRLVVISFHSLEDRVVKRFLREHMELPFRKPVTASPNECVHNPRARSAKLRCGVKKAS